MDREQDTLRTNRKAHPDGHSSDAILRDIERTRGAMDNTLEELGDRMHPRQLLDDAMDLFRSDSAAGKKFRRNAKRWGGRAVDEVRDNPIPALLIGAGIAWLAFGSREEDEEELYYPSHGERYRPGSTSMPDDAMDLMEADYDMDTMVGSCPTGIAGAEPSGEEIDEALMARTGHPTGEEIEEGITSRTTNHSAEDIGRDDEAAHGRLRRAGHAAREKARNAGESARERAADARDRVRSGASNAKGKVAGAGHTMRSKAGRGMHRAGERMHDWREGASDMGHRARRRGRRMQQRTADSLRENYYIAREQASEAVEEYPMAVAAGALAMGLLAGILMPRTRREDALMGPQSDAVKDTARSVASETAERAKETAVSSAAAAANTMEEEGLSPDQLVEKASHVAQETKETFNESLEEESLSPEQLKEKLRHVGEEAKQMAKEEAEKHREAMSEEYGR